MDAVSRMDECNVGKNYDELLVVLQERYLSELRSIEAEVEWASTRARWADIAEFPEVIWAAFHHSPNHGQVVTFA